MTVRRGEPQLTHGIENTPLHWLEAITDIREGA